MKQPLGNRFQFPSKYGYDVSTSLVAIHRLFLLSSHYHSDVDFTDAAIEQAQKNFEKVYRALASLEESGSAIENSNIDLSSIDSFEETMNDDFNTPVALSVIYSAVKN